MILISKKSHGCFQPWEYCRKEVFFVELKSGLIQVVRAERECDVYCPICHKVLHVEAGQVIPRCCGKTMEEMDR